VSDAFKELLLELAQERSLEDLLPLVTRRLVEHEDVALARLWLVDDGDQCATCPNAAACPDRRHCLHLVASARRQRGGAASVDARLDGAFRRIPIGAFKVGAVASAGAPVLVTDPATDPKIRHPAWIRQEGIAGFAGLPLSCRGEMLGVLGVFVRAAITPAAVDVLRIVANHAAAAIATARAFQQVETMRQKLLLENQLLRRSADPDMLELVGHSPKLRAVLRQITSVAGTDATVLVLGESGTGKELVARALHKHSRRAGGPFIEINCAAIPRELSESELFGHVRGAFSGATRDRVGRFEAASGGTLFLDEIGELPLELQGKLLRVLQEGTFERVGEVRTRQADVRVVAATNRNLMAEVEAGRFRADLYYRLAVYPITLPALRERKDDIAGLVTHLLGRICRRLGRPPVEMRADQLAALARRDWPGNVRELLNVLERAVISADGGSAIELPLEDEIRDVSAALVPSASIATMSTSAPPAAPATTLAASFAPTPSPAGIPVPAFEGPEIFGPGAPAAAGPRPVLRDLDMRRHERDNLRRALETCGGKIYGSDGAAALLGVKPTTLASRLKRLHLVARART